MHAVPLAVIVIAHPSTTERDDVVDWLVRRVHRDPDAPFAPRPAVPVVGGTLDGTTAPRHGLGRPSRLAIVAVLDDHAVTDPTFLDGLDALAASTRLSQRLFVVPRSAAAYRVRRAFADRHFLRVDAADGPTFWRHAATSLVHELSRWLQARPRAAAPHPGESDDPIEVFVSHAKRDGLAIAEEFREYLHRHTRLRTFFDAHDIGPGFHFANEIDARLRRAMLLVVRTDAFGTRDWCQREVLGAKGAGIPVVVVEALDRAESRAFPYLGNAPSVRYRPDDPERHERILEVLLDETLRQLHFRVRAERVTRAARVSGIQVHAAAPELVRFALAREDERRQGHARSGQRRVVYPDPPISAQEARILAHGAAHVRAESLTQFLAQRRPEIRGSFVALSTSEAPDITARGLTPLHQRDLVVELARHIFIARARLAYGGDLRRSGFTELLVDVARAHTEVLGTDTPACIRSYLAVPLPAAERADLVDQVEFIDPAEDGRPPAMPAALRAMRLRVAHDIRAAIVVGGRETGFSGWRPGVEEEVVCATARGRPVYLLGGFGGVASRIAEAVFFKKRVAAAAPTAVAEPEPAAGAFALPQTPDVVYALRSRAVPNGLSLADNRRLARSVDVDEIVAIVLRGLATVFRSRRTSRLLPPIACPVLRKRLPSVRR